MELNLFWSRFTYNDFLSFLFVGQEYKTEVHSMMMKEVDTMTASIKANIRMLQRKIKELLQKTKAIASGMVCFIHDILPKIINKIVQSFVWSRKLHLQWFYFAIWDKMVFSKQQYFHSIKSLFLVFWQINKGLCPGSQREILETILISRTLQTFLAHE